MNNEVNNSVDFEKVENVSNVDGLAVNSVQTENGLNNDLESSNISNNITDSGVKKNKKKFVIFGCFFGVVVLLVVGLFSYRAYVSNPLYLYKKVIQGTYEKFSDILDEADESEVLDLTKESILIDGKVKLNSNIPDMDAYTKYNYDYKLGLDIKNKKMELGASMKEGSKEVISGVIYFLEEFMYIDSKQFYNKPLYQMLEEDIFKELNTELSVNESIDFKKIDKLAEKYSQFLINALNEKHFKEESDTIYVNGKKVKVDKIIYQVNEDSAYEFANSFINDMKSDDEFIALMAEFMGLEKSELKETFDEAKVSKDDFVMEETGDFYLYKTGFFPEIIGFGFEVPGVVFSYAKVDELSEVNYNAKDGESEFKFVVKTKDDKSKGSIVVDGKEALTFTLVEKSSGENINFDLDVVVNEEDTKLNIGLDVDITEESDKKSKGTIKVNISGNEEGEKLEFGGELDFNIEIGAKIADFDKSSAVDITTLSEAELEKITKDLEELLKDTFLYDILFIEDEYEYNDELDDGFGYDNELEHDFSYDNSFSANLNM